VSMATVKAERPPSGPAARALTIAALLFPILLLPAILYQRKARDEAAASEGRYEWPRSLINRPVAFYLATLACLLGVMFILALVLAAFGVPPV
jgi:ABC-type Fe3+ transport system permease subunit